MLHSPEQLLAIAREYWRADALYDFRTDSSPENQRLCALWESELKGVERWWALLETLERALPEFSLGDATATADASFRCAAYPLSNRELPPVRWAVVGCVSILAPVYTVYGVRSVYRGTMLAGEQVFLEALPPEMRRPAEVIAQRIEAAFGVEALPHGIAATAIPLFVEPQAPPHTTLFHALFTGQPERIP